MPVDQVGNQLRARVLHFAADAGKFVDDMRIEGKAAHSDSWFEWRMAYRPGPPGLRYGSACGTGDTISRSPR
ncbi:hypothetical protein BST36_07290 [Mycolicibacterium moriokaense]|uniref:Uncharacterized protein n=1 Tax=Mycolicibacterium moriokaense TaxID=39691 RepID=A0AAD1HG51_9MYCO|nr:hypothetical protein BST36_07290 [Mycolicibacterium moriokaense]BBX03636.1 hypothetical protein MMOR_45720 [Mycolicibacterium moriokaense]